MGRVLLVFGMLTVLIMGCGGNSSTGITTVASASDNALMAADAPSMPQLQSMLQAEFARLGIDPAKVAAKAPQKSENAVFDLAAVLVDPDGEGGDPPTGITLGWTERLLGDYNQDGMVTESDLTPLGQNYCFDTSIPQVTYDEPGLHGGIAYWPTGDPADDDDGAMNWRLARVDGNNDGRIYQSDMTPIAVHWEERLTGYRVWRKAPGQSFELVPNPAGAGSDVTLARPATISPAAPVRYAFSDDEATAAGLGEGAYAYYVQPYDGSTGTSGPVSVVVVIDNTGTVTPEQPVAHLTVTPDFGGAPVVVTLDASGSTDSDGTVEVWHWDFDADGVTDWVSTDAVPEESSTGNVDTITPGAEGVVTVTYHQGSREWYFPGVVVEDNDGLTSLPAHAQLGISGWESELLYEPIDFVINFSPSTVSHNPVTGQVCMVGYVGGTMNDPWTEGSEDGIYWAERTGREEWNIEMIQSFSDPAVLGDWDFVESMYVFDVVWNNVNEPTLFLNLKRNSNSTWVRRTIILSSNDDDWSIQLVLEDYSIGDVEYNTPDTVFLWLARMVGENAFYNEIGRYENDILEITETGFYYEAFNEDILYIIQDFYIDEHESSYFAIHDPERIDKNSLFILNPTEPGLWEPAKLFTLPQKGDSYVSWQDLQYVNGSQVCLCDQYVRDDPVNDDYSDLYLATISDSDTKSVKVKGFVEYDDVALFATASGYHVFAPGDTTNDEIPYVSIEYCQYDEFLNTTCREVIADIDKTQYSHFSSIGLRVGYTTNDGQASAIFGITGAELGSTYERGEYLALRVDPGD